MIKKFILICAQQRSGTTVFQKALDSTPHVMNCSEIFHQSLYLKKDYKSFHLFKKRLLKRRPNLSFPSKSNQKIIWDSYLTMLSERTEKEFILIDVKYNSWHHLNPIWANVFEEPFLVKQIKNKNMYVVHITRQNKFSQYLSAESARKRQVWHSSGKKEIDTISLEIDNSSCLNFIESSIKRDNLFIEWFKNYDSYTHFTYEELFVDGNFNVEILENIYKLLNKNIDIPLKPNLVKINNKQNRVIANNDQIKDFFSNTIYSSMIEDVLDAN